MKKFLAVILAIGVCVAFAMPAAAAVSVRGDVGYELVYTKKGQDNPQSTTLNNNGYRNFEIQPNVQKAFIRFDWEAGPATPYLEFGIRKYLTDFTKGTGAEGLDDQVKIIFGVDYTSESGVWGANWNIERSWNDDRLSRFSGANLGADTDSEDTAYDASIWWQVNPMLKLSFGELKVVGGAKTPDKIGVYTTHDNRHVARAQMGFPVGKLTVDLWDPYDTGTVASGVTTIYKAGQSMNTMPGLAIGFSGKMGPISFDPSYMVQKYEWEGLSGATTAGNSGSVSAWGLVIPVKVMAGPVSLGAAYAWGENTSLASYKWSAGGKAGIGPTFENSTGNWIAKDTEYTAWQVEANVNAGIGKLSVGYYYDEGDAYATATTRTVTERDEFRVAYAIPVGKGFTITPIYRSINDGETKTGGILNPNTDDATRKIYSVNFNVKF